MEDLSRGSWPTGFRWLAGWGGEVGLQMGDGEGVVEKRRDGWVEGGLVSRRVTR